MRTLTTPASRARFDALSAHRLLAAFLIVHGFAHLAGTSTGLRLAGHQEGTEYLVGTWHVGGAALVTLAVAWALTGAAFAVVALLVWRQATQARPALIAVAAASLILSTLALWTSVIGAVIDLALIAAVTLTPHALGLRTEVNRQSGDTR